MSFCEWLPNTIRDVHTTPAIKRLTIKGSVTGEEGLVSKITNIRPSNPPTAIACILILK